MSDFAQSNPIVNPFWAETEDVSLREADFERKKP